MKTLWKKLGILLGVLAALAALLLFPGQIYQIYLQDPKGNETKVFAIATQEANTIVNGNLINNISRMVDIPQPTFETGSYKNLQLQDGNNEFSFLFEIKSMVPLKRVYAYHVFNGAIACKFEPVDPQTGEVGCGVEKDTLMIGTANAIGTYRVTVTTRTPVYDFSFGPNDIDYEIYR